MYGKGTYNRFMQYVRTYIVLFAQYKQYLNKYLPFPKYRVFIFYTINSKSSNHIFNVYTQSKIHRII